MPIKEKRFITTIMTVAVEVNRMYVDILEEPATNMIYNSH